MAAREHGGKRFCIEASNVLVDKDIPPVFGDEPATMTIYQQRRRDSNSAKVSSSVPGEIYIIITTNRRPGEVRSVAARSFWITEKGTVAKTAKKYLPKDLYKKIFLKPRKSQREKNEGRS